MIKIKIPSNPSKKLLTRRQILKKDGVYASENSFVRFVVASNVCFIIGDQCPIYVSGDFDMDTPKYYETSETIVFEKDQ